MDLSDVQKSMEPGAQAVIKSGIGLYAGLEAFSLTAINLAIQESGGNQMIAARKLGLSPSYVSQAVNGKTLTRYRGKRSQAEK